MSKNRVAITGIGVCSPIGMDKQRYWQSLYEGISAFRRISLFDTADLKVKTAGEITDFNPQEILGKAGLLDLDRATILLLSATKSALDDAHLNIDDKNAFNISVSVGTTLASFTSISCFQRQALSEGPRYANPSVFPSIVCNSPASRVSIRFHAKGFNSTISTGMCAGLDAIGYACQQLMLARTDKVIVGSVIDLSLPVFLGLNKLKLLAGLKGELLSCPFDKRRNGIVFSEGATALILQDKLSAQKERKHIYAEVLGIGSCFDPGQFYKYNPEAEGMEKAMRLALEDAKLSTDDIDCIFANANSTQEADYIETLAIKEVFGRQAYKIPVTAIKSILGETLCASGGFAVIAGLGALEKGVIPATINYSQKDKHCDLDYVPNKPRTKKLSAVMINAFDCKGANTSLIIGKP